MFNSALAAEELVLLLPSAPEFTCRRQACALPIGARISCPSSVYVAPCL